MSKRGRFCGEAFVNFILYESEQMAENKKALIMCEGCWIELQKFLEDSDESIQNFQEWKYGFHPLLKFFHGEA